MGRLAHRIGWDGPLCPCLDHGGPWLKDRHSLDGLSLEATLEEVRRSLTACLSAGYKLLHIDVTVDRSLPPSQPVPIDYVVDHTVDLIDYAETERRRLGLPPVDYEVGTEEVHGGLADHAKFEALLHGLQAGLRARGRMDAWPCFIVGKVGTDLHTTLFDAGTARTLTERVSPLGTLIKGHYTDWVENLDEYPAAGMGGANVGPEFTAEEVLALSDLCDKERRLCRTRAGFSASRFLEVLESEVRRSGRWKKWLLPAEASMGFDELSPERRAWMTQTGARYVWRRPAVVRARRLLYENLSVVMADPHGYVVDRIVRAVDRYVNAFGLFDACTLLEAGGADG